MKILKPSIALLVLCLTSNFVLVSDSSAIQITSEVYGSPFPTTTTDQNSTISNGDFKIFRSSRLPDGSRGYLIGDGINEFTKWNFDFRADPDFLNFDTSLPLSSADLLITLIPKGQDFSSDFVRIDSLANFYIASLVPVFTVDDPVTLRINLLELYNSDLIISLLKSGLGTLGMRYEDDAIVVNASLQLSNSVPEPASFFLFFSGLGFYQRYKNRNSLI